MQFSNSKDSWHIHTYRMGATRRHLDGLSSQQALWENGRGVSLANVQADFARMAWSYVPGESSD